MKYLLTFALLCLLSGVSAFAQIRVELEFDQEQYLPDEEMLAKVRIYNSSGQTLSLGKDNEWLSFSVEGVDGSIVSLKKDVDVTGEFTLPSAHRATRMVDLAKYFDLNKFNRYVISAKVKIADWGQSFASKSTQVDISTGVKLWETSFGVPGEDSGRPEIRKYVLAQANHVKRITLYVRITDESEAYTYKLFPIGEMISFSRPEPQVDRWSNLHVLYQDGARTFRYTVITPDGLLLKRQTWQYHGDSRPQLAMETDGRLGVKNGIRRVTASDLPPPELLSEKSPAPSISEGNTPLDAKPSAN